MLEALRGPKLKPGQTSGPGWVRSVLVREEENPPPLFLVHFPTLGAPALPSRWNPTCCSAGKADTNRFLLPFFF